MSECTEITVKLTYEQIDKIMVDQMEETRDQFLLDMESIEHGINMNFFVYNDNAADLVEMQKHVDALNLLLSWYGIPKDV
jgi:hypothetical protein